MATSHTDKASTSPAVRSLKKEQARQAAKSARSRDDELAEGLKDSFPASDPISVTGTTTAGEAKQNAKRSGSKHERPM